MESRLKLLGSPVHPIMVHLPIGLYMTSLLFDAVFLWRGGVFSSRAAFWLIALGLLSQVGAMASGIPDYLAIAADKTSPAFRVARLHLLTGLVLFALYLVNLAVRMAVVGGGSPWLPVILNLIGNGLLGLQGRFGGELVYRHGIGVEKRA